MRTDGLLCGEAREKAPSIDRAHKGSVKCGWAKTSSLRFGSHKLVSRLRFLWPWCATRKLFAHIIQHTNHPSPVSFFSQAKTTKKITLRLTCTQCKTVRLKPIKRAKHFEICDKKPKGKGAY